MLETYHCFFLHEIIAIEWMWKGIFVCIKWKMGIPAMYAIKNLQRNTKKLSTRMLLEIYCFTKYSNSNNILSNLDNIYYFEMKGYSFNRITFHFQWNYIVYLQNIFLRWQKEMIWFFIDLVSKKYFYVAREVFIF